MKQLTSGGFWIAAVAVLSACTAENEAVESDAATATPNVVTLSTADHAFQAPDTINAGWTTFRFVNRGEELHYAHIVRLEPGRTAQELVDGYVAAIRTSGPRPTWMTRYGGPGAAAPGESSSVTQYAEPGSYVWICPIEDSEGIPHFSKGEVQPFVIGPVDPHAADEAAPEASAVIRLVDYGFALEPALSAGRHTIRVENAGTEPHDVALIKLPPGATLEDLRIWLEPERARRPGLEAGQEPPPPMSSPGGVAVISPGMEAFFEAELTPGEYVLVCFTTAPDGRSHIEHGMIRQISVS